MRMMGIGEAKAFVEDESLSAIRAESLRSCAFVFV